MLSFAVDGLKVGMLLFSMISSDCFYYVPFEKGGAYCFAHVGRSVDLYDGMSVFLNLVQLITQEYFGLQASNLVGR